MATTIPHIIPKRQIPQKFQEAINEFHSSYHRNKPLKKDTQLALYGTIFSCSLLVFLCFIVYVFIRLFIQ